MGRFVAAQGAAESIARSATHLLAREVRIETAFPMPVLADSKLVGATPARFRIRAGALRVIVGDGDALSRPPADTSLDMVRTLAHALPSQEAAALPVEATPRDMAIAVLSEVVPAAAEVAEHARSARSTMLPIALALVGGALLGPALRRLSRR
jgi:hypothetical protein